MISMKYQGKSIGDVHPTKLYLLQESSAEQGEGVAKEELEGRVDGGEETRTC